MIHSKKKIILQSLAFAAQFFFFLSLPAMKRQKLDDYLKDVPTTLSDPNSFLSYHEQFEMDHISDQKTLDFITIHSHSKNREEQVFKWPTDSVDYEAYLKRIAFSFPTVVCNVRDLQTLCCNTLEKHAKWLDFNTQQFSMCQVPALKTLCCIALHKKSPWNKLQNEVIMLPTELKSYLQFFKKVRPITLQRKLYKLAMQAGPHPSSLDQNVQKEVAFELFKLGANALHCLNCYDPKIRLLHDILETPHECEDYIECAIDYKINSYEPLDPPSDETLAIPLYWSAYGKALFSGNASVVCAILENYQCNTVLQNKIMQVGLDFLFNVLEREGAGIFNQKLLRKTESAYCIWRNLLAVFQKYNAPLTAKQITAMIETQCDPIIMAFFDVKADAGEPIPEQTLIEVTKCAISSGNLALLQYLEKREITHGKKIATIDPDLFELNGILQALLLRNEKHLSVAMQNSGMDARQIDERIQNYYNCSLFEMIMKWNSENLSDTNSDSAQAIATLQFALRYGFLKNIVKPRFNILGIHNELREWRENVLYYVFLKKSLEHLKPLYFYLFDFYLKDSLPFFKRLITICQASYPEKALILQNMISELDNDYDAIFTERYADDFRQNLNNNSFD